MEENLRARLSLFADLEAKIEKLEKIVNEAEKEIEEAVKTRGIKIAEARAAEARAAEARAAEARAAKARAAEARAAEARAEDARATEARAEEARAAEVRAAEARAAEARKEEARAAEARVVEAREAEAREAKARAAEVEEAETKVEASAVETDGTEEVDKERETVKVRKGRTKEAEKREKTTGIEKSTKYSHSPPTVLQELAGLGFKIAIIVLTLILTFTFVFGFHRNTDPDMTPMIKAGDLVMYYRLDKNYSIGDLLVLEFDGELQVRRVIAKAGDLVDIDERGLKINEAWQQELEIYQETWRYEEGIDFPVTVGPGQVFVLGDERESATDSRMYGAVDVENTRGTVVTVIRRRNF